VSERVAVGVALPPVAVPLSVMLAVTERVADAVAEAVPDRVPVAVRVTDIVRLDDGDCRVRVNAEAERLVVTEWESVTVWCVADLVSDREPE
jgi:hypothetical protein